MAVKKQVVVVLSARRTELLQQLPPLLVLVQTWLLASLQARIPSLPCGLSLSVVVVAVVVAVDVV